MKEKVKKLLSYVKNNFSANYLGIKKKFMSKAIIETLCSKQNYDGSKVSRLLCFNYNLN